ncbi:MAG TPA: Uma2 family endonuclease [Chloroflexia bacterium]|nr:Uma2 family endonuclease [Chloroflexia bacterium]
MAIQIEQEEQVEVKRHVITLDEYEAMCVAGVFEEDARVELIRGVIVDMAPPGPEHEASVAGLNRVLSKLVGDAALVWPQGNAVRLPDSNSRPQPDITILRWRDDLYRGKRPVAEDVILLVEVSQSSLKLDRGVKLTLYAEAGIPEYWVVDIKRGIIEVYTEPAKRKYQRVRVARRGEKLQLPGGLEGSIEVSDVIG